LLKPFPGGCLNEGLSTQQCGIDAKAKIHSRFSSVLPYNAENGTNGSQ